MVKKTITFEDYNGNKRSGEYYFNLNEAEITELSLSFEGNMETYLNNAVATDDMSRVFKVFKAVILAAVGIKSPDGMYFDKSEEIRNRFEHSPAFNALLLELTEDEESANKFITSMIPKRSNAVPAPEAK